MVMRRTKGTGETSADVEREVDERAKADNLSSERGSNSSGFAEDQLFSFVERVERLTEEKQALQADIKEVFDEAKAHGFDTKTLRKIIARRNMDAATRQEMDAVLDLYEEALGRAYKRNIARLEQEGE